MFRISYFVPRIPFELLHNSKQKRKDITAFISLNFKAIIVEQTTIGNKNNVYIMY